MKLRNHQTPQHHLLLRLSLLILIGQICVLAPSISQAGAVSQPDAVGQWQNLDSRNRTLAANTLQNLPTGQLVAEDPRFGATFGSAVAMSGDLVVIGAASDNDPDDPGAVYVFMRDGDQWRKQKLTSPDPTGHDRFGHTVATDGNIIVVGAPAHDPSGFGVGRGAVYLFPITNGVIGAAQKLTSSLSTTQTQFGYAVALSDGLLVVGEPDLSDLSLDDGRVSLFIQQGGVWRFSSYLYQPGGGFGKSVATDGARVVVGAPEASYDAGIIGKAYVFVRAPGGWDAIETSPAVGVDGIKNYGRSVAVYEHTIAVGAVESVTGGSQGGAVYLFNLQGEVWSEVKRLVSPDTAGGESAFGWSLAISGEAMAIGDPNHYEDGVPNGAAYLYRFNGSSWSYQQRVSAPAIAGDSGQFFAQAVAVSHDSLANRFTILSGAPFADHSALQDAGAAYVLSVQPPLNTTIAATMSITQVVLASDSEGFLQGKADLYGKVQIGNLTARLPEAGTISVRREADLNWALLQVFDTATVNTAPLRIELWDEDSFLGGSDDQIDVSPGDGRTFQANLDLNRCTISGDVAGNCEETVITSGAASDRAQITFSVSTSRPQIEWSGALFDQNGQPVSGPIVSLVDSTGQLQFGQTPVTNGAFSFAHVAVKPGVVLRARFENCPGCLFDLPTLIGPGVHPVFAETPEVFLPPCEAGTICRYAPAEFRLANRVVADWPRITSVSPPTIALNHLDQLTIRGARFQPGVTATLGGVPLVNLSVSAGGSLLQADPPPNIQPGEYTLTVTNPDQTSATAPKPITVYVVDVGLRPRPDGYRFGNYKELKIWQIAPTTVTDIRRVYGDRACMFVVRGECLLWPAVAAFLHQNNERSNGDCLGMSVTSLGFASGVYVQSTFTPTATTTYSLPVNAVGGHIGFYQLFQDTKRYRDARNDRKEDTPRETLERIRSGLAKNPPEYINLDFFDKDGGHTIVPYAIEQRPNGISWVRVYDPNFPNNDRRIFEINTIANTWSYHLNDEAWWRGDAASETLAAVPVSVSLDRSNCPPEICSIFGTPLLGLNAGSPPTTALHFDGVVQPTLTDAQGRRIGYVDDAFINEIPGAYRSISAGGLGLADDTIYDLPATGDTHMILSTHETTRTVTTSVAQFGAGYATMIEDLSISPQQSDQATISADGRVISYQPAAPRSPTFIFALDASDVGYELQLRGVDIGDAQTVTASDQTQRGTLVLNGAQTTGGEYTIHIARTSNRGLATFISEKIALTAGATHMLDYGGWTEGELRLNIDLNSDGSIDKTITLRNQAPQSNRVYLPLLQR